MNLNTRLFIKKVLKPMALACALTMGLSIGLGTHSSHAQIDKLLRKAPKNWKKWGKNDEVGALNYLDQAQTLRGMKAVKSGKTFTLQIPMIHGFGPVFPGRIPAMHYMAQDESTFASKKKPVPDGGVKYSDDTMFLYLQGTSHVDALGHAWYGKQLYGGYSADTSNGGHTHVDVSKIGEKGIVGHAVLLDVGRLLGDKKNFRLAPNTCISLNDLKKVAQAQNVKIEKRDILLIRTGSVGRYYDKEDHKNWDATTEPGLCYSAELVKWINDMEIPMIAADNLAVEKSFQTIEGKSYVIPLHGALIRDLGVVLSEVYWLDDLAADSAKDKKYNFFFVAAPLKVQGGTGSPVNPVVIK